MAKSKKKSRPEKQLSRSTVSLQEILSSYDIVDIEPDGDNPYMIVSDRGDYAFKAGPTPKERKDLISELGTSAANPYISVSRTEYNRELQGLAGLQKYDQMRRSDGVVRGTLRMVKTPVLAARWYIEPASDSKRDQNVADFVWKCLTEYMSISFPQLITECLLMADFGNYMFEKVWQEKTIDGHDRLVWGKLAPRHPMDVVEWKYDKNGGPKAVVMQKPEDPQNTSGYGTTKDIEIEIEKLLVFTFDREAGNIEGISLLRSAYKHWYYKEQLYKIDAIQKERHGIGIPVIKLPPNYSEADKVAANTLGRNLRTNERAHIVLPPFWDLVFAKLEGQPVDALASIKMHDSAIRENILTDFVSKTGSNEEDQTLFLKATRFVADILCETFNTYAIPQLVRYNFERVGIPKLKARRIGEQQDWRTLSFAIRNLIGAGVIRPDDTLEAFLREEMDLPRADVATVRIVQTPQGGPTAPPTSLPNATPGTNAPSNTPGANPGTPTPPAPPRVGMPRQAAPSGLLANRTNNGIDRSGS